MSLVLSRSKCCQSKRTSVFRKDSTNERGFKYACNACQSIKEVKEPLPIVVSYYNAEKPNFTVKQIRTISKDDTSKMKERVDQQTSCSICKNVRLKEKRDSTVFLLRSYCHTCLSNNPDPKLLNTINSYKEKHGFEEEY